MTKNSIYGEILYVGFVAEKGRVFSQIRSYSYRKAIREHFWQRMIWRMMDCSYTEEDEQLMDDFIGLCQTQKSFENIYSAIKKNGKQAKYSSQYETIWYEQGGYVSPKLYE